MSLCFGQNSIPYNEIIGVNAKKAGFIDLITHEKIWRLDETWFGNLIMDPDEEYCTCC
jgi:hypothetical protein